MRRALGDEDRDLFANRVGIPKSSIANYERGERVPDTSVLAAYRTSIGVDINWLATGDGAMFEGETRSPEAVGRLLRIPRFDVAAAAGGELLPAAPDGAHSHVTVERGWLGRFLPGWAGPDTRVGILEGWGDSMRPTIDDGDLIMVANDPPAWAVDRGGIFVLLHRDLLRIRRVQIIGGDVHLISDNKNYAVEIVPRERVKPDLRILGQVFFAGGRVRSTGY